ncbi:MAG: sugar ABC transporter ATP-binding protein [Pseudomonadota bacterium]
MSADPPALELRGLAKAFGAVQAVRQGDLTVRAGEVVALLGANGAGKSTLMNMLGGVLMPDDGEIRRAGQRVAFAGPQDAREAGIAFVQQELSVFPTLTVAENVFADGYPTRAGRIDRAAMRVKTRELLETLGADLDPDRDLEGLSTGACQMVEIARAMRREPEVVIFDEPTSSLSAREKARFHDVVGLLASRGVAVVYITHFIGEIFGVCDRAVVLREGETVANLRVSDTTQAEIVEAMLGSVEAVGRLAPAQATPGAVLLKVESLALPGRVEEASFALRRGEIVGLWGLLGSGRTELVRALLGLDGQPSGAIRLDTGAGLVPATPEMVRADAAFVTEDRKGEGLLLPFSVADNVALPSLPDVSDGIGRVRLSAVRDLARRTINALTIKVSGPGQRVGTLSGGNQQKVVFGKWLATMPDLLILDEPTRGLDLSAKTDILRLAVELAGQGAAVLVISSELEELMRVSQRYLIVRQRRLVGTLPGSATEAELIAALSDGAGDEGRVAA